MTKLIQISILFFLVNIFSQEKISLKGKVLSKNNLLNQVHIYNVDTSKGTLSNIKGNFEITVRLNDVLVVNIMPYKEQRIKISNEIFESKNIKIHLQEEINELELVEVNSNKLTGSLAIDSKNVPKDINQKFKFKIDVSKIDFSAISDTGSGADRGNAEIRNGGQIVPVGRNVLGLVSLLADVVFPEKYVRPKPRTYTDETPSQMRIELGDTFFIKELHIPKTHIDDFLEEYCNTKEFIDLFEENKIIECIEYLFEKNKLKKYVKI